MTAYQFTEWINALNTIVKPGEGYSWKMETDNQDLMGCFVLEKGLLQQNTLTEIFTGIRMTLIEGTPITDIWFDIDNLKLNYLIKGDAHFSSTQFKVKLYF